MASQGAFSDEPLSPAGRLFIDPKTDVIIHVIASGKSLIDIDFAKSALESSVMVQHPRFHSLLVRDENGLEHWRRTKIDIDQHVIVFNNRLDKSGKFIDDMSQGFNNEDDDGEEAVNQYVADLSVSSPLSTDKPLWEIHVLTAHKCAVFRIHHALGDGFSLMSMLMAGCGKVEDVADHQDAAVPTVAQVKRAESKRGKGRDWFRLLGVISSFFKTIQYTLMFVVEFVLRNLFVCDKKTVISGGDGVELWPRKLATAKFLLEDMREVKKAIPNTTINDVLYAVISSGLSRYLEHRTPNALHDGLRLTGVAMVNLRANPGVQELSEVMKKDSEARWGNKFGAILLPVYYHKAGKDPLVWLKRAKVVVDMKKHSLEAYVTYRFRDLVMNLLGPKYVCLLYYKLLCNTTFTISNFMGPVEKITIAGYPVSSMKFNTSSLPQALSIYMLSYVGRVEMQLLVAKDIIPDPEFLAKCFEDALLEMRMATIGINKA
ncbi:NTHASE/DIACYLGLYCEROL ACYLTRANSFERASE 11, FOLDED PETAL 1 [Hibiscus trionum]|uniref:NTHASE/DIACYLGLYCEROL ACYLTRANSFERASE 11, FOLDED PETAL 1 n=1 Tax=Hibiscus trionum TaxID=183268 RepID=A0A9W7HCH1_HIBTR|nr:NTHASE/DIACYLGLYCEROL ACYLTRANSFERASE 11, FOLDED PETAL 1 [Hibiscus trionum]